MARLLTRRRFLTTAGAAAPALLLGGCDRLGASPSFRDMVLGTGEWLSYRVHRLIGSDALAREFDPSQMSPEFRTNGNTRPKSPEYLAHAQRGFADWRLAVDGLVERPQGFSLAELKAMPARTQITRHDCVEGWSAIGQWTGVQLGRILEAAGVKDGARYIVFRCADRLGGALYYESCDMIDARHPQTILAWALNGAVLPIANGAPLRLRIERQLGYKHAKYLTHVEAVASLDQIGAGKGGYWEDRIDYEWYAGI
jgi:DMSO/TMAO reductase YedYZ molybdopterin-dependent catalytic subunit